MVVVTSDNGLVARCVAAGRSRARSTAASRGRDGTRETAEEAAARRSPWAYLDISSEESDGKGEGETTPLEVIAARAALQTAAAQAQAQAQAQAAAAAAAAMQHTAEKDGLDVNVSVGATRYGQV